MSISTNTGLFSGIDTGSLIQQLISLESRPVQLAQQRVLRLSGQQAALLTINSSMNSLENIARGFRTSNLFQSSSATSSNSDILTATANTSAQPGNLSLVVDRLVSTQQVLSRGFADRDRTAVGASSFTFEGAVARLDTDIALSDLNGGDGVDRGVINLTVGGSTTQVDLSRTTTIGEVVDAINSAGTTVRASVEGDGLVLSNTVAGAFTIGDQSNSTTAADLGILGTSGAGDRLEGGRVYFATENTALSSLNDGAGIDRTNAIGSGAFDFQIIVDSGSGPQTVNIFLGERSTTTQDDDGNDVTTVTQEAAEDLGDVVSIANQALTNAGITDVTLRLNQETSGLEIVNSAGASIQVLNRASVSSPTTTATDLGIETTTATTDAVISGRRLFGGLNSTLLTSLNGGSGIGGDGVLNFTDRAGNSASIDVSSVDTLSEVIARINAESGLNITASLNSRGTGLLLSDTTATGAITGNLIVTGTGGDDTAASLGISTGASGVSSSSVDGSDLEKRYITRTTRVAELNNGAGIGVGSFTVTNAAGVSATVEIGANDTTIRDILDRINQATDGIVATLNSTGDGILIADDGSGGAGSIRIEDIEGGVAAALNIAGTSTGTGEDAEIDGTAEVTIDFEAGDTLNDLVTKINSPGKFVRATVLNTGDGSQPFRLSLTSRGSGSAGEFIIDSNGFDLGLTTLSEGRDARVFFGSSNPADGLVLTSSTNTLNDVLPGVSINLKSTSDEVVDLSVSRNVDAIVEEVGSLFSQINTVLNGIATQTAFNPDTGARGPLLGDSTVISLQRELISAVQGVPQNVTGQFQRLSDVGIGVGEGGRIEFDEEEFRAAYGEDPEAVERLLSEYVLLDPDEADDDQGLPGGARVTGGTDDVREFASLGFAGILEELGRRYTDTIDGVLTRRLDVIESQIDLQNDRVGNLNIQLAAREQQLANQFLAMERAIGQLQSQQAALSQISFVG